MFEFPTELETLNDVPEAYQSLYAESETGFVLDPGLAEKLDVSGLTSALEKERNAAQAAEKELKLWRQLGDEPQVVIETHHDMQTAMTGFQDSKLLWQEKEHALNEEFNGALKEKDDTIEALKASNEQFLITSKATEALLAAKGSPDLLMPHIRNAVMLVEEGGEAELRVIDTDGSFRLKGEDTFMTLTDLVEELRASSIFARAFDPVGNRGSGMDPAGLPLRNGQVNRYDGRAINARIEDIAAGKVAVTL